MQLFQPTIEFLRVVIEKGQIVLQPYISEKILKFSDQIGETKELQKKNRIIKLCETIYKIFK